MREFGACNGCAQRDGSREKRLRKGEKMMAKESPFMVEVDVSCWFRRSTRLPNASHIRGLLSVVQSSSNRP